jgi:tryptophan 2,3-dioxygenase
VSPPLLEAFHALRRERGLSLLEVYTQGRENEDLYQLAEALTEWDESVGVWRFRHFKVVSRIIGEDVVGTQGTPVELLAGLIKYKLYPELWAVRTELTELAKQSD